MLIQEPWWPDGHDLKIAVPVIDEQWEQTCAGSLMDWLRTGAR